MYICSYKMYFLHSTSNALQELGERECFDNQVCRRVNLTFATCQNRTGRVT